METLSESICTATSTTEMLTWIMTNKKPGCPEADWQRAPVESPICCSGCGFSTIFPQPEMEKQQNSCSREEMDTFFSPPFGPVPCHSVSKSLLSSLRMLAMTAEQKPAFLHQVPLPCLGLTSIFKLSFLVRSFRLLCFLIEPLCTTHKPST